VRRLADQILEHSQRLPEGALLIAVKFLHFGERRAVNKALAHLSRRGDLLRIWRGLYVRPIPTVFGTRNPTMESVVARLTELWGESIATHGAVSANRLGLTTQVPVRAVYLTSGPGRVLWLGGSSLTLYHAPLWQFVQAGRLTGEVIRALAWLGPSEAARLLPRLSAGLSPADREVLIEVAPLLPTWLAEQISRSLAQP
jgi:hypothetical protein